MARSTKESEMSVLSDLKWLGLKWDEGPDMEDLEYGPYRQSERSELYKLAAEKLLREGKAYKCFCTKEELELEKEQQLEQGLPARYGGKWRDADPDLVKEMESSGAEYTVRFKVPKGSRVVIDDAVRGTVAWDADATVGDFILLRSSGVPVYNFCVAVDDALMGVTTVIRAEEHLTNTLRQGLVLDALEAPRPKYAHCSLILGEDQQKLSKRHGATSCTQFKDDGFLPDAMVNYLSLLGWNDGTDKEVFTRDELVSSFDMSRINPSGAVFDLQKLKWINSNHLKMMSIEEVAPLVKEQLLREGVIRTNEGDSAERITFAATCLAKQMMATTKDAAHNAKCVLNYDLPDSFEKFMDNESQKECEEKVKLVKGGNFFNVATQILKAYDEGTMPLPNSANLMEAFVEISNNKLIVEDNDTGGGNYAYPAAWKVFIKGIGAELGLKGKNIFHPTRLAMTGEFSGQEVTKQMSLLSLCSAFGSAVDLEHTPVMPLEARMEILRSFVSTIPEEFRVAKKEEEEKVKETATRGGNERQRAGRREEATATSSSSAGEQDQAYEGPPFSSLDIRVGLIKKVWKHEESDKLFCEEVDVGEEEPRKIASGLQPFFSESDLQDRKVLVLCNLKERKLAGFPSHGMVLCSGNDDHTEVKFVDVPTDAAVGERVYWGGDMIKADSMEEPAKENRVGKKKIFEKMAPYLKTDKFGVASFLGKPIMTSAGPATSSLGDGSIS